LQPTATSAASAGGLSKSGEHETLIARGSDSQAPAVSGTDPPKLACTSQVRPGEDGYCPPPVVPEAPIATLLPLNALAVLLLGAAYLVARRRKQDRAGG
jgi:hypothetical protein